MKKSDVLTIWGSVAVIVLVLFALAIGNLHFSDGRIVPIARADAEIRYLKNSLESFFIDNNSYPFSPASGFISEASVDVNGRANFLTTPVSYIPSLPYDPFVGDGHEQSFRYYSDGKTYYMITSNGPDRDIDITREMVSSLDLSNQKSLSFFRFDPTNGTESNGDVFTIGP